MTNPSTLRAGDHGAAVTTLQTRLTAAGYATQCDGWYGPSTEAAVRAFQQAHAQVVDGIAGPRTQAALQGRADPRALTQADIVAAAAALDCDPAAISAVIEVESPNGGFLPDGRVVILFERHIFWQQLIKQDIQPAHIQAPASICSQHRGGYVGGAGEYPRLAMASAINLTAAQSSCSWGRFQIMGYHAEALDYDNVADMVARFATGEAEHLRAFVAFIQLSPDLPKALRARKWSTFAKGYNGPNYAANHYDARLATAYKRHVAATEKAAA